MFSRQIYAALLGSIFLTTCQAQRDSLQDGLAVGAVEQWVTDLSSDNQQVRYSALVAINEFDDIEPSLLPGLIRAVDAKDRGIREEALRAIVKLGPAAREATPRLVELLNTDDSFRALSYAMAIGYIGGAETKIATRRLLMLPAPKSEYPLLYNGYLQTFMSGTVSQLIVLLKDEAPSVRARAALMLGLTMELDRHGVPYLDRCDASRRQIAKELRPLLQDKTLEVRVRSAAAIAKLTPTEASCAIPAIVEGVTAKYFGAYRVERLLKEVAADAIPQLIDAMDHPSVTIHHEFVTAINKWPHLALPHLTRAIENDDSRIRAGAAYALGSYQYAKKHRAAAIKCLIRALDDDEIEVRLLSAESLINHRIKQEVDLVSVLTVILQDGSPRQRERSAASLGELGGMAASAVPSLLKLLQDPDLQVRFEAASAITRIDVGRAGAILPVLREAITLEDPRNLTLRHAALRDAQRLGVAAASLGAELISELSGPVDRNNYSLLVLTAKTLAIIDPDNAAIGVGKLAELLPERERISWYQRKHAIDALVKLGPVAEPAFPTLLKLVHEDNPRIAILAAVASVKLNPTGSDNAWELLRAVLAAESVNLQNREQQRLVEVTLDAIESEKEIAVELLPELISLLEIPDCHAQGSIVSLLASLGPAAKPATAVLRKLANGQGYISVQAKNVIRHIADEPDRRIE